MKQTRHLSREGVSKNLWPSLDLHHNTEKYLDTHIPLRGSPVCPWVMTDATLILATCERGSFPY